MILFDARAVRRRGLREGFRRETVESLDLFVRATREFELRRRHDDGFDASWDADDENATVRGVERGRASSETRVCGGTCARVAAREGSREGCARAREATRGR